MKSNAKSGMLFCTFPNATHPLSSPASKTGPRGLGTTKTSCPKLVTR